MKRIKEEESINTVTTKTTYPMGISTTRWKMSIELSTAQETPKEATRRKAKPEADFDKMNYLIS